MDVELIDDIDVIPIGALQDIADFVEDDDIADVEVILNESEADLEPEEIDMPDTPSQKIPRWQARAQARSEQPSRRPRRRHPADKPPAEAPTILYHFPPPEPPKPRPDGVVLELWGLKGNLSAHTTPADEDSSLGEKARALAHYHSLEKVDISTVPDPTDAELLAIEQETDTEIDEGIVDAWHLFANCLGVDPDLFFPERGASTKEAKGVCRGCVVREDCLEYALQEGEKFGIWGGLSERERRRIRRQRALARAVQLQAPREA